MINFHSFKLPSIDYRVHMQHLHRGHRKIDGADRHQNGNLQRNHEDLMNGTVHHGQQGKQQKYLNKNTSKTNIVLHTQQITGQIRLR